MTPFVEQIAEAICTAQDTGTADCPDDYAAIAMAIVAPEIERLRKLLKKIKAIADEIEAEDAAVKVPG